MASNIYLTLTDISGESAAEGHANAIEILNLSYSCFQPVSEARSGSIHTSGRVNHGTVNFSKYTDSSTAGICAAMWAGKTIKTATFSLVTNDDTPHEYMKIVLDNVVVSNFSIHGGGNSLASEEVSLSFSKIAIDYNQQEQSGGKKGTYSAAWDLATEKKAT